MPANPKNIFQTFNLAKKFEISPAKAKKSLTIRPGGKIKKGDLLACHKSLVKNSLCYSPVSGVLDSIDEEGVVKIKKQSSKKPEKKVSLPGRVVKIRGQWGRGKEAKGVLDCFSGEVSPLDFRGDYQDQILAFSGRIDRGLWHKAKSLGVKGIICGGLPDKEFETEIAKEKILVKGEEEDLGLPLVVFTGEGKILAPDWNLLMKNKGKTVVIRGQEKLVLVSDEV